MPLPPGMVAMSHLPALAGPDFGATTLSRFYAIHMLLVPGLIAALIGAPIHHVPSGLTLKEIVARFPGTLGWTALRPWLLAIVIAASALVLMVTVSFIITAVLLATGQLTLPAS